MVAGCLLLFFQKPRETDAILVLFSQDFEHQGLTPQDLKLLFEVLSHDLETRTRITIRNVCFVVETIEETVDVIKLQLDCDLGCFWIHS
jgi:hypothetical protein